MKTIQLSPLMPAHVGGKPKRLGSYTYSEAQNAPVSGVFVGYDHEHACKVVIDYYMLKDVIAKQGSERLIYEPKVVSVNSPFKNQKKFWTGILSKLIPKSIKKELISQEGAYRSY